MTADAYATAFMVLGSEEAKSLCAKVPGLEYFIICSDSIGDGYHPEYSEGFRQYLVTADK
jgi:thiamine biosynthesis lipoprotein